MENCRWPSAASGRIASPAERLNGRFLAHAIVLKVTRRDDLSMRVFRFSISYLMWLFLALLVDHYLPTQALLSSGR